MDALEHAAPIPPVFSVPGTSPEKEESIWVIGRAQEPILNLMHPSTLEEAQRRQSSLDPLVEAAREKWAGDPVILNLAGYRKKNGYLLKHWNNIQAGMAPRCLTA